MTQVGVDRAAVPPAETSTRKPLPRGTYVSAGSGATRHSATTTDYSRSCPASLLVTTTTAVRADDVASGWRQHARCVVCGNETPRDDPRGIDAGLLMTSPTAREVERALEAMRERKRSLVRGLDDDMRDVESILPELHAVEAEARLANPDGPPIGAGHGGPIDSWISDERPLTMPRRLR